MFSQRFGYAAHGLTYMARKPFGSLTTLSELAEWIRTIWTGASEAYLSNVLQRLARGGVLLSHRGIAGGYSLARPADQITLRDVAELLEGVSTRRCSLSLGPACSGGGECNVRRILRLVEEQYLETLEKITIAELSNGIDLKLTKGVPVS